MGQRSLWLTLSGPHDGSDAQSIILFID